MSDTDVPLHEYLNEVLGYLQILGKNIQKRTKNISENRINEKYLSSPENVKKTADKINLICNLSKASIDKVQNGVKNAVDSYIQKSASKTNVSNIKSATEISSETTISKDGTSKSDSSRVRRELGPGKIDPVEDSTQEALSTKDSVSVLDKDEINTKIHRDKNGVEWIKYNHKKRTLFLPAHIDLDKYFNCSVKIVPFHKDTFDKHKFANVDSICSEKVYTKDDTSYNKNKSRTKPKHPVRKEDVQNNYISHQDKKKKIEISDLENMKGSAVDVMKGDKLLEKSTSNPNKVSKIKHSDTQGSKKKFKRVVLQESSDSDNDGLNITDTAQNIDHSVSPNNEYNLKIKCVSSSDCGTQNDNLTTEVLTKCNIINNEITAQTENEGNQNTISDRDQCTDQFLEKEPSTPVQEKTADKNSLTSRNKESDTGNIKTCDNGISNINDKRRANSSGEQDLKEGSKKLEKIESKQNDADQIMISSQNNDHSFNEEIKDTQLDNNIANDLLKSSQNRETVFEDGENRKDSSDSKTKKRLSVDNSTDQANLDNVDYPIICSERQKHNEMEDRVSEVSDTNDALTNSQSRDKVCVDDDKIEDYLLPDSENKNKLEESNQCNSTEGNQVSKVVVDELSTSSQHKELPCDDNGKQTNFSTVSEKEKQLPDVSSVPYNKAILPVSESIKQVPLESDAHCQLLNTSDIISTLSMPESTEQANESPKETCPQREEVGPEKGISETEKQLPDVISVINNKAVLPVSESIKQVPLESDAHCQLLNTSDIINTLSMPESTEQENESPKDTCPQSAEVGPEKVEESVTTELQHKPLIRCVNIANLLATDALTQKKKEVLPQINIMKPRKIVTFLDNPIEISSSPEKIIDRSKMCPAKSPSSILLKGKERDKAKSKRTRKKRNDISSNSDSDISSASQELFKRIKLDILDGRSQAIVKLPREPLASWAYAESLSKYGIKKVYNEFGELYSKEPKNKSVDMVNVKAKQADSSSSLDTSKARNKNEKDLNEKAKLSVLNSSSSSDSDDDTLNACTVNKSKKNATCSDSVSDINNPSSGYKKKKKFSKRRHKNQKTSDSEAEIEKILSLPKRKRERSRKPSNESPVPVVDNADEENNESEEMGRSLRLKGRTEPAASPEQSKKER